MRPHHLVAALCLAAIPATAAELPPRKPGLWELKMNFAKGAPPQVMQQCTDASTDKLMHSTSGDSGAPENCAKRDISTSGGQTVIDSVCVYGGKTMIIAHGRHRQLQFELRDEHHHQIRRPARAGRNVRTQHDPARQMARSLRGGSEARRHDHARRREDQRASICSGACRAAPAARRRGDRTVRLLRRRHRRGLRRRLRRASSSAPAAPRCSCCPPSRSGSGSWCRVPWSSRR